MTHASPLAPRSCPLVRGRWWLALATVVVLLACGSSRDAMARARGARDAPAAAESRRVGGASELAAAYRAADRAADAVVLVEYVLEKAERGFGGVGQRADMASVGVIVDPDGLVVLSSSIFPEDEDESRDPALPRSFTVRLRDGRRLPASFVGRDRVRAVAFVRVDEQAERKKLPHVTLESVRMSPGDPVVLTELLGERYAYEPTFRRAVIGAVLTRPRPLYDLDAFVQDSGIGTPVIDATGRAVGIVLTDPLGEETGALAAPLRLLGAISRNKEPGFPVVVPASELLGLIGSPPSDAKAPPRERSWLGVTLQPVDRPLAGYLKIPPPTGVMVTSVWAASPAERAGLKPEDVIVSFDGRPVEVQAEDLLPGFIDRVQAAGVGREVALDYWRAGTRHAASLTLAAAPKTAARADEYRSVPFGLVAQDLTIDVALGRRWSEDITGALVSEIENAGWAQVGGIERGDLIQAVNGAPIANVEDLAAALAEAEKERTPQVVFFVFRDPDTLFIPVKTQW